MARAASDAAIMPATSSKLDFDLNNTVDRTEMQLLGTKLSLTSSVFGFPDFRHLVQLRDDGSARFYGGMVAREDGRWCVILGDPEAGERPDDLYVEFTQPLTDRYMNSFTVPGGVCFWRGKLEFSGSTNQNVAVEGGVVVSEREEGTKLVREGVFTAVKVDDKGAAEVRSRAREAFERALTTPKSESTGFKTPARIAGIMSKRQKALPQAAKQENDVDIEDD